MTPEPTRTIPAPARPILLACMVVAVANGLLLGSAALRARANLSLQSQVQILRDNLATLVTLRAEHQTQLDARLAAAQTRTAAAEAALPRIGAPLNVFRIGYDLGDGASLLVYSIRRDSSEIVDTAVGPVETTTYRVEATGTLDACLAYIDSLEAASPGLGLAGVSIVPETGDCSMDVLTLGRAR
jgi:hypothetical protein